MNLLSYLLIPLLCYVGGYFIYARILGRVFGESDQQPTPAYTYQDGKDYVPTKSHVLFAHHFASIAGAGPILGPTFALLYGSLPVWIWIVFGAIFLGAVHDFSTLFVSIREGGKSMAEVARKTLGENGFKLYILFILVMVFLVTAAFLKASAVSLTSQWPLAKLGLNPNQTLLKTFIGEDGILYGRIGGIASMSVLIITAFSPFFGYLLYQKQMHARFAYPLAILVGFTSILIGICFPISLSLNAWMILISIYVLIAARLPVWMVLQPRDFINVQILYIGLGLLGLSLFKLGLENTPLQFPSLNLDEGISNLGLLWPMLFITIACGAISGFHGLVSSGTTSKQISHETHAKRIGYVAMLGESTLGLFVTLAIAVGLSFADYRGLVWPTAPGVPSNPILAFALGTGSVFQKGLGIPLPFAVVFGILLVEGFIITTLDVAIRLNRYLFEELWSFIFKAPHKILMHPWFNAGLSVGIMWLLAKTQALGALWPIFGTANQLLAAVSLIAVSLWFFTHKRKIVFTFVPALLVGFTTISSLFILLKKFWSKANITLITADILLIILVLGVCFIATKAFIRIKRNRLTHP